MILRTFQRVTLLLALVCAPFAAQSAEEAPMSVPGATTVSVAEAKKLFDDGAIFVDPRPASDFDAGRIPEAEHLPIKSADFTAANLEQIVAKADPVVFYCNGTKCALSSDSCEKAIEWGWTNVYFFREGFPGWKSAGYPVE